MCEWGCGRRGAHRRRQAPAEQKLGQRTQEGRQSARRGPRVLRRGPHHPTGRQVQGTCRRAGGCPEGWTPRRRSAGTPGGTRCAARPAGRAPLGSPAASSAAHSRSRAPAGHGPRGSGPGHTRSSAISPTGQGHRREIPRDRGRPPRREKPRPGAGTQIARGRPPEAERAPAHRARRLGARTAPHSPTRGHRPGPSPSEGGGRAGTARTRKGTRAPQSETAGACAQPRPWRGSWAPFWAWARHPGSLGRGCRPHHGGPLLPRLHSW